MIKKKLVLTYPNHKWIKDDSNTGWNLSPYTLCLLGTMVEDEVEVYIVDAQLYNMEIDEFKNKIIDINPDYVGISVLTSEYGELVNITSKIIKKISDKIITIVGGVHATMEYKNIIKNENIDYVVRGEGEYTLLNLIRYLNGTTEELPKEGVVTRNYIGNQVFVNDISKLPRPNYNLVKLEDYLNKTVRLGPLVAKEYPAMRLTVTRGCPFGCVFCQVENINGTKIRTRDPDDVIEELLYYKSRYGIKYLMFDDDNIVGNKKFFKKLLNNMIERELNIKFAITAFAIFLLDDEMLDLMKRAGCIGVNIAIESGNKRVLKEIIRKPINLERVPKLIKKITDAGLVCLANFIIGFPEEKWDEIRETIRYAENCGADYVKFFVAVPLKNTKLWDMAVKNNSFTGDMSGVKVEWRYSQIKSNEWTSKDVTILRAYEWDRINFSTPEKFNKMLEIWNVSPEELNNIRKITRDCLEY